MVKARVSRSLAHRFNPLAEPESEASEPELLTRLRSPDDSEREIACISAGTLRRSSDPDPLIKVLIERISDPCAQVRLAALQACDMLTDVFHQNLLGAGIVNILEFCLNGYFSLEGVMYESEVERQTAVMVTCAGLDLLSSLCEHSSNLLTQLTNAAFISRILVYLATGSERLKLVTSCMGLLQVMSEDNHQFLESAPQDTVKRLIEVGQDLQAGQLREQAAVLTVLCNYLLLKDAGQMIKDVVIPPVLRLIGHNLWQEYSDSVQPNLKECTSAGKAANIWIEASAAVESTLEIMANLLYSDEEDETPELFTSLVSRESVGQLMTLALGLPLETVLQLSELFEEGLQAAIFSVQLTAISVLKNIILSGAQLIGADEAFSVSAKFHQLTVAWSEHREEVMSKENIDQLVSGSLALIQICLKRLSLPLPIDWVSSALGLANAVHCETAVNAVALISCMSKTPHTLDINREVCKQLLICCRSKSLALVNESLNAFFDIYCEETYDEVLQSEGVISLMMQGLPHFLAMVQKEANAELKDSAELTATNLRDFIEYKQSHMH